MNSFDESGDSSDDECYLIIRGESHSAEISKYFHPYYCASKSYLKDFIYSIIMIITTFIVKEFFLNLKIKEYF